MDYISGWCTSERRLNGFTVVVTGANGGIGRETTADLYKRGARVIMACRNLAKGEAVKQDILDQTKDKSTGTLAVEKLDLCSLKSIQEFAKRVIDKENSLRILINNAGVMCCPQSTTEDGFETHMGSNHLGHALLTFLLLPKLIKSAPSRIIFVSSALHYFYNVDLDDLNYTTTPYVPLTGYARSKIANIMFSKALAQKLRESEIYGVTTYSVHPGVVYTDIDRHFWRLVSWTYRMGLLRWVWKSARCGAQTTIHCAVDDACAQESGLYYSECAPCPPSSYCQNEKRVMKLWDHTIQMLQQKNIDPSVFELPTIGLGTAAR